GRSARGRGGEGGGDERLPERSMGEVKGFDDGLGGHSRFRSLPAKPKAPLEFLGRWFPPRRDADERGIRVCRNGSFEARPRDPILLVAWDLLIDAVGDPAH